jgi:hypothetical protein
VPPPGAMVRNALQESSNEAFCATKHHYFTGNNGDSTLNCQNLFVQNDRTERLLDEALNNGLRRIWA